MPSESVKVAVRVRPFNQREKSVKSSCILAMRGGTTIITNPENKESKTFTFDHAYWSHDGFTIDEAGVFVPDAASPISYADQYQVFSDLGQGVLDNAWQGYNAALFAYGQTGSGKSYSMLGYGPNKGIVPITCGKLFTALSESKKAEDKEYQVTFSIIEIYNEQVRDLLIPSKAQPKGGLRMRQHPQLGFYVEGLKQVPTETYEQMERLMDQGAVNRTTASTNMNATSSRSHMVITITFKQIYKNQRGQSTTKSSRISLVDLAGSERASSAETTGDRLKEGSVINQSLSTLGKVISALADLATGKSNIIVPYRDSVLTKLLQSALGGNSKTIMIAALSPAAINYEETLSTLRYADRTKKIKNQAIVNESPTDKLIRELKEEKNRLLEMLKKMENGENSSKLEELEQMLSENKRQMADMHLTWEQRMEMAKREWEKSLTTKTTKEDTRWQTTPHLQNVNEDPQLSGIVKVPLEKGTTTIGKNFGSAVDNKVEIRGIGIMKKHVLLENNGKVMTLKPGDEHAEIAVNGKRISKKQKLVHMDRVKLGSNSLYVYVGFPKERSSDDNILTYDYDYILSELADHAGIGPSMLRSMSEDASSAIDPTTALVFEEYIKLLPKVYETNAMSEEMDKGVSFEAEIKNLAGHDDLGRAKQKEIMITVTNSATKKVWTWSREKFRQRKYMIEDIYCRWMDGESADVDASKDPFWDPVEPMYLGSCHVWLNNIAYCVDSDEYVDIQDHRGRVCASLHTKIVPCDKRGKLLKEDQAVVEDPTHLLKKSLNFLILLSRLKDVEWVKDDNSRGVYMSFSFFDHPQVIKTNTVAGSVNPTVDFKKHFSFSSVGPDLLNYLQTHALVIELWGTQAEEKTSKFSFFRKASSVGRRMSLGGNSLGKTPDTVPGSDVQELRDALARKEREAARLREERNELQRELQSLRRGSGSRRESVSSDVSAMSAVQTNGKPPAARKPSLVSETSSMDADMAKALKLFFKDVKDVQLRMSSLITSGEEVIQKAKKGAQKEALETRQKQLGDIDLSLDNCVGQLKESMFSVIRRKKQDQIKSSH